MKDLDLQNIQAGTARQRMEKALDYKREIDALIGKQPAPIKALLNHVIEETDKWLDLIYDMVKALDEFETNPVFRQDRSVVAAEIGELARHLSLETEPDRHAEIEQAIEIRQRLLGNLDSIHETVQHTEGKIDETLEQLRQIYAKLQMLPS